MTAIKPWPGAVVLTLLGSLLLASPAFADYADGWRAFQRGEYTRSVDLWRQSAWIEDDIHSQKQLGDLYREGKFAQRDVIESYVWYYLALVNPTTLGQSVEAEKDMSELLRDVVIQLDHIAFFMTIKQKQQAQDRIVYVLASRGAEGHFRLAELYDAIDRNNRCSDALSKLKSASGYPDASAPVGGEDAPDNFARIASLWVFCEYDPAMPTFNVVPKSNIDSLIHFTLADRLGQPAARRALKNYHSYIVFKFGTTGSGGGGSDRGGSSYQDVVPFKLRKYFALDIITQAEGQADVWQPPFEVYPGGHSDESKGPFERQDALKRVATELDPRFIQEALKFLTFYQGDCDGQRNDRMQKAIGRYQASIGAPVTGYLSAEDTVRVIKDVADRGYAPVQAALGTMYFHGIGEPQNYARAKFWFEKGADQLDPYALFNLAVMYRDGLGVEVDASQAATYFVMAKRVLASRKGKTGGPEVSAIDRELKALGWSSE